MIPTTKWIRIITLFISIYFVVLYDFFFFQFWLYNYTSSISFIEAKSTLQKFDPNVVKIKKKQPINTLRKSQQKVGPKGPLNAFQFESLALFLFQSPKPLTMGLLDFIGPWLGLHWLFVTLLSHEMRSAHTRSSHRVTVVLKFFSGPCRESILSAILAWVLDLLGPFSVWLQRQSLPLPKQVNYYSTVYEDLVQQLGSADAQNHLSKSLFTVVVGSNDLFDYFKSGSDVSKESTPQQYVDSMLTALKQELKVITQS